MFLSEMKFNLLLSLAKNQTLEHAMFLTQTQTIFFRTRNTQCFVYELILTFIKRFKEHTMFCPNIEYRIFLESKRNVRTRNVQLNDFSQEISNCRVKIRYGASNVNPIIKRH